MPIEVLMPALSPTMKDGKLVKWCKKEGDEIIPGDVIAEVETDKATMEIEAIDEGRLGKILVEEGQAKVAVNSLIALILEDDETEKDLENFDTTQKNDDIVVKEVAQSNSDDIIVPELENSALLPDTRIIASPLAKKIASNENLSLKDISGSGPRGRIIKNDVLNALSNRSSEQNEDCKTIEISTMRRVIAERLVASKQSIPHFYLKIDCQLDKLLELRKQINETSEEKITINDFIIKASGLAIKKVPIVNSSWQENYVIRNKNIDISVAVSVEDGLITPIIKNADEKSLVAISKEMKTLAKRAKENSLKLDEFQGGCITISNMGMYEIKEFFAIINPPQSAILAIGSGEKRPAILDNKVVIKTVMAVTLSCDHRIIDGAIAAKFLNEIKNYIENPLTILI